MEVHAHTHTARKKWTHYLWEFIMLFLAVFCGFLAENQREHYVEHQREKQYMRTMLQDLESDTSSLNIIIADFKNKLPAFDTLISEIPRLVNKFSAPFARNIFKIAGYEDLVPNDRTIQQLKNAGGMRLIRKSEISDSIMAYDKKMKDLSLEQEGISDFYYKFRNIGELINIEFLANTLDTKIMNQYEKDNKNLLVSQDKSILSKYLGYLHGYIGVVNNYIIELKMATGQAIRLSDFIRKEYHLK